MSFIQSTITKFQDFLFDLNNLKIKQPQMKCKLTKFTLRNFKFSSNKICWSTGIKFTLAESFNKI